MGRYFVRAKQPATAGARATAGLVVDGPTDGAEIVRVSPSLVTRCGLMVVGAVPVLLIGLSTIGVWSLEQLVVAVLLPALGLLAVLLGSSSTSRVLAVRALAAGVVATFVYDLFRWSFLLGGLMERDPIPHIGTGLGLEPGWVFGYLWRFVGNGGGIALSFYAIGGRGILLGTTHGLVVCSGLLATLQFSPNGQEVLFPLGPETLIVAIGGHIIYGAVLGAMAARFPPPVPPLVDRGPFRRMGRG